MTSFTWGGGSGSWNSSGQWLVDGTSTGGVPGGGDDALIGGAAAQTITESNTVDLFALTITDPAAVLAVDHLLDVDSSGADPSAFSNAGTITLDPGAHMEVGEFSPRPGELTADAVPASFVNTGVINIVSAVLDLNVTATTAGLGTIRGNPSSQVQLSGTLNNAGATVDIAGVQGLYLSGVIDGGAVSGNGFAIDVSGLGAEMDGVTVLDPMTVVGGAQLAIAGGLTMGAGGGGTLTLSGAGELYSLDVLDSETLNAMTLLADGSVQYTYYGPETAPAAINAVATLTLGSGVLLSTTGAATLYGDTIVSQGSIAAIGLPYAGSTPVTLDIKPTTFVNEGVLTASGVSSVTIGAAGGTLVNTGSIVVDALSSVTLDTGVTGAGTLVLAGGTVEMPDSFGDLVFSFVGSGNLLKLDTATVADGFGELVGLTPGNTIELLDTPAVADVIDGTLSALGAGALPLVSFVLAGLAENVTFQTSSDVTGDTFIVANAACFAEGTHIGTPRGPVPVELLREGDAVSLADGGSAPLVWLGHRRVDCRRHPRPHDVLPVRVRKGAFGPGADGVGRPVRDLVLSPDHAVLFDGVLIPVRYLLNGATIVQQTVAEVRYFHVELPAHAIILAEGLATESYLDTGNRAAFANGGAVAALHPDFARRVWDARGCAELVMGGTRVAAAKRHLLAVAAAGWHRITEDSGLGVFADGVLLRAERDGAQWRVGLPYGVRRLRLASRSWQPAHMRPHSDDTRRLGVAIAKLRLDGVAVGLEDARLGGGWHAAEAGWRWTDGDAELDVAGHRELRFDVAMSGTYWSTQRPLRVAAAG